MAPGRTCAEGQSREASVGPDGRCRVQDQAVRICSDLNVLVQTYAAGKAVMDSRFGGEPPGDPTADNRDPGKACFR
jgi:hypothetical protein